MKTIEQKFNQIFLTLSRSHVLRFLALSKIEELIIISSKCVEVSRSHALTFFFLCLTTLLMGQPTVKVEVSADTINPGELVEVTYTIENGEGRFEAPDFQNLPVVSGPNTSSSFMFQNGKKSSSQSYSFILKPVEEGKIVIPSAYFREKDHDLKIDPVEIVVLIHAKKTVPSPPETKSTKQTREKRKF